MTIGELIEKLAEYGNEHGFDCDVCAIDSWLENGNVEFGQEKEIMNVYFEEQPSNSDEPALMLQVNS